MRESDKNALAVLITCHNRVETTLRCLECLFHSTLPEGMRRDVYLVDDGSTDGTGERVKENFPSVTVLRGPGDLYWAGGMRKAWSAAAASADYDFYILLNDDAFLAEDAFATILSDLQTLEDQGAVSLMVGVFTDPESGELSYSGAMGQTKLAPTGRPQLCDNITGNFLLVPRVIYQEIGGLSPEFTHGIADTDYGLRAIEAGFACHITGKVIGKCHITEPRPWCDPSYSLKERWANLFSIKRGNLRETARFVRRHHGCVHSLGYITKALLRACFPRLFAT